MTYRWLIINEDEDNVEGTNNPEQALAAAKTGAALVIDTQEGTYGYDTGELTDKIEEADPEAWLEE